MGYASIFWTFCISAFISGTLSQGPPSSLIDGIADDFCVDRAFQRWHVSMVTKFSKYAEFTSTMSESRSLFQALFTQDFTTDAFKAYCKIHEEARKEYDKCDDSEARKAADIGFALADHVCIRRVETFSQNIPCLQQWNNQAFDQCKNSCRAYEQGSHRYTNPDPVDLINSRMNWIPYMASDCQYLKCMADCRRPIFEKGCSSIAAALENDALKATFAKKIDYYDPPLVRSAMRDTFMASVVFPVECQQLIDEASPQPT